MTDSHVFSGRQVYPRGPSTDDHRTPLPIFKSLQPFHLDVAASHENALCERYYTLEEGQDGLEEPWFGVKVWCNPPYRQVPAWIEKAIHETKEGHAGDVWMLLPARTCTRWFRKAWENASEIRFIHGRLDFTGPHANTSDKASAPFPSILVRFTHPKQPLKVSMVDRQGKEINQEE